MRRTDVAIVGAGPAGLSAAAALIRRGVAPLVVDGDDRIGGRWARHYERLRLHTVRGFSGLAHRAMPRTYPRYVPKDLVARYLDEYARHFGIDVRLGTRVGVVRAVDGEWEIVTSAGTWRARAVVLATGHHHRAVIPEWPGRDLYAGRLVHAADYSTGRDFAGRRVLVVGLGNTGAEIAADLVEQGAAEVHVAVRTPPPIVPRELLGVVPVQLLGLALSRLPAPRLLDRLGGLMRRVAVGDLRPYGLGPAAWGPFTARRPPVIDVGFLEQLQARRVTLRRAVTRLTSCGAAFADGSEAPFDAIVCATGYETGLGELLDLPGALDAHGMPRYPSGRRTPHPGLYFIGYDETIGGHLRRANLESRRLAREVASHLARHGESDTRDAGSRRPR